MLKAELPDAALFASVERHGDLSIHGAIDVRRPYPREALERALRETVRAFPVFDRTYQPRFWRDAWVKSEAPLPLHEVETDDLEAETLAWVKRPIDQTRERPIRVVSIRQGARTRLLLTVMHLAVDGAGVAAVAHLFGAYLHGQAPAAPIDTRRHVTSVLERWHWTHLPAWVRDFGRVGMQPARLLRAARRDRHYPKRPADDAAWTWLTLSPADVQALKARCGTSMNDVLAAALARIHAARSQGGDVAVTYTMDLRRFARSPRLSAANTSSILTAIVPREGIGDLATTARAVAKVTRKHREGFVGPALLLAPIAALRGLPHELTRRLTPLVQPLIVDLPLSRGLMMTNVGRIDHGLTAFGDALEDVKIIGPNLRGIEIPAVVAYGFRGALHLHLFSPPGLGKPALDELERELRAALELPSV